MSLEQLFPEGKTVTVAGEAVTVRKFMFTQFGGAAKRGKPILAALFGGGLLVVQDDTVALAADWPLKVIDVLADGGDAMVEFCAFATGLPVAFFDNADIAEGLELLQTIFEVNWDFIKARILPKLGVNVDAALIGLTPSTPSSLPVTSAETLTPIP